MVIADGKRGDVPHTASVYAENLVGTAGESGLGADAATVNPLMGGDVLDAVPRGRGPRRRGLFVLVRTSNAGAADPRGLTVAAFRCFFSHRRCRPGSPRDTEAVSRVAPALAVGDRQQAGALRRRDGLRERLPPGWAEAPKQASCGLTATHEAPAD